MSYRNLGIKRELTEEEIQKLIGEIDAEANVGEEGLEERLRKEGEWLLKNNKIQIKTVLNRDTNNLIWRAQWFTDLNFDEFIDYAARLFAIKVLKANGCELEEAATSFISVNESQMGPLELNEDEKLNDDTIYAYLGYLDRTESGKSVVIIPDLNVAAYGNTDEKAFDAAEEVLTSALYSLKATNSSLPEAVAHTAELKDCRESRFVYSLPLSIFQTMSELKKGTMKAYSLDDVLMRLNLDE